MASMFSIERKRDGKLFGVLLVLTAIYITYICFNEFNLLYVLLFMGIGILALVGIFHLFRILGATPVFLVYRSPFEEEQRPKLDKRSMVILAFMGLRLGVALLVFLDVPFVFVAIAITIIDVINSKIIILTGKSVFWDKVDNNLDIFSRLLAVLNYLYLWWIPVTIVLQYVIYVIREIDLQYTWLRTFPPDVIWMVYAIDYGGVAIYIVCIIIFILNMLSYALLTGKNGILLRPS